MQVLIVHADGEIGGPLAQMIRDYTSFACELVRSDAVALAWARRATACDFLATQLESDEVDGLALGGSLSEFFPRLQVAFLPSYPASAERIAIAHTKVFPEPIDGERFLEMLAAAAQEETRGDLFQAADILQMCCLAHKTGALQLVHGEAAGFIFMRGGELLHAECGEHEGAEALREMLAWPGVELAYDGEVQPDRRTLSEPWENLLG